MPKWMPAWLQCARDIFGPGEVPNKDLGARPAQRVGVFVVAPHKGPDWNLAV